MGTNTYLLEINVLQDIAYAYLPKKVAGNLVRTVKHWQREKGLPFVISYFKEAQRQYIDAKGKPTSRRWTRGVLANLVRYVLEQPGHSFLYKESIFMKFMKIGSIFNRNSIGKKDYLDLAEREARVYPIDYKLAEEILEGVQPFAGKFTFSKPIFPCSNRSVFLDPIRGTIPAKELEPEMVIESLYYMPRLTLEFYHLFERCFSMPEREVFSLKWISTEEEVVGACNLIAKDGNWKLRDIYVPNIGIQLALEPLYQALDEIARSRSYNFMYNQEAGGEWVRTKLKAGLTVYTIDLDEASMTIPLSLQYVLMRRLLPSWYKDYIRLFYRVSTGQFKTPFNDVTVTFRFGQPMGVLPSFLSFSLLLYYVYAAVAPEDSFAMVGDDLVTTSEELLNSLKSLGLKISRNKTYASSLYADFVGTTHVEGGSLDNIRIKIQTKDPLSRTRAMGWPAARRWFRRMGQGRVGRVMSVMRHLPPPFGLNQSGDENISLSSEAVLALYETSEFLIAGEFRQVGIALLQEEMEIMDHYRSSPDYRFQKYNGVPENDIVLPYPNGVRFGDLLKQNLAGLQKDYGWSLEQPNQLLVDSITTCSREYWQVHLTTIGNLLRIPHGTRVMVVSRNVKNKPQFAWQRVESVLNKYNLLPKLDNKNKSVPPRSHM